MNSLLKLMRNIIVIFFIIIHHYCSAQTIYNTDLLLKTWKLQSMTRVDGKPYLKELPNELIRFKKDSIWERKRGSDKSEGIWYFDAQGLIVIQCIKINGNPNQSREHKFLSKIKELDSDQLILIYLEREGNDVICIYSSYSGN